MIHRLISDLAVPTLVISTAYVLAFAATFAVVMPVQDSVLPEFGNYASLVFLAHGVRVIAAWMYGWRSLLFLAPGAVLTHSYLYGAGGFSFDYMVAVFSGVVCAALGFWAFARLGLDFRLSDRNRVNWRDVMLVGAAASIVNSVGTKIFFDNDLATASARLVGDVTGMVASIVILMLMFRAARRLNIR